VGPAVLLLLPAVQAVAVVAATLQLLLLQLPAAAVVAAAVAAAAVAAAEAAVAAQTLSCCELKEEGSGRPAWVGWRVTGGRGEVTAGCFETLSRQAAAPCTSLQKRTYPETGCGGGCSILRTNSQLLTFPSGSGM